MSDIVHHNSGQQEEVTKALHSGDLGLERPVNEFDNTTLSDAVDSGLVVTPDDASTLLDTEKESVVSQSESKKSRLWLKIGAPVVAVLAVASGAVIALRGNSNEKVGSAPVPTVTETGPSNTTPVNSTPETTPSDNILAQAPKSPEYAIQLELNKDTVKPVLQDVFSNLSGFILTDKIEFMQGVVDVNDPSSENFIQQEKDRGQALRAIYEAGYSYLQADSHQITQILDFDSATNTVEFVDVNHTVDLDPTFYPGKNINITRHMSASLKQVDVLVHDEGTNQGVVEKVWVMNTFKTLDTQTVDENK